MNIQINVDELIEELNKIDPRAVELAVERIKNRQLEQMVAELRADSHDGQTDQQPDDEQEPDGA